MPLKQAPLYVHVDLEGQVVDDAGNPLGGCGRLLTAVDGSFIQGAELQSKVKDILRSLQVSRPV